MKTNPNNYLGSRSYGYNTGSFGQTPMFNWCGTPATVGQITRPAEIVMMGDVMQDANAPGRFSPPSAGPMLTDYDGKHCKICGQNHNAIFVGPNHVYDPRPG